MTNPQHIVYIGLVIVGLGITMSAWNPLIEPTVATPQLILSIPYTGSIGSSGGNVEYLVVGGGGGVGVGGDNDHLSYSYDPQQYVVKCGGGSCVSSVDSIAGGDNDHLSYSYDPQQYDKSKIISGNYTYVGKCGGVDSIAVDDCVKQMNDVEYAGGEDLEK